MKFTSKVLVRCDGVNVVVIFKTRWKISLISILSSYTTERFRVVFGQRKTFSFFLAFSGRYKDVHTIILS